MFILDTDILTLIQLDHPRAVHRLKQVDPDDVTTTIVTKIQMLRGRHDSVLKAASTSELLRAQERLSRLEELPDELEIIGIDAAAGREFERLRQNKKLKNIGRADLLIASVALAHRATLVSRNVRDFRQVPGLQIENWAD